MIGYMVYFFVVLLLVFLRFRYDVQNIIFGKKFAIYLVTIILICLAGFRYRIGLDTMRYMEFYYKIPTILNISMLDYYSSRHEPLYFLIESISKLISPEFFVLQIFQAIIVNIAVVYFLVKNTKYIFTGILIYFLTLYISFNFEGMRSAVAVSMFLFSYEFIKKEKWNYYFLLTILASLFHTSAIILFFVPLVLKLDIRGKWFSYIILGFVISFALGSYIDLIFEQISVNRILSQKAETYLQSDYLGQMLNYIGVITHITSLVVIPSVILQILKRMNTIKISYGGYVKFITFEARYEKLIMLNIIIAILTIKVQIFYRFLEYFTPFLIIGFSEVIGKNNFAQKGSANRAISIFSIVLFLMLKIYGQYFGSINGIPNYNRYLPYSSIFSKEESLAREKIYNSSYSNFDSD